MSLESAYYVSQIIAAVAVVASLIYLGLQQRQSSRNQLAQMHAARIRVLFDELLHIAGDGELSAILVRGGAAQPSLTDGEIQRLISLLIGRFASMEEEFHKHREGMSDDNRWRFTEAGLKFVLTSPGHRATCRIFQQICSKEFSALLDRLMAEGRKGPPVAAHEIWKLFAAEEAAQTSAATA